MPPHLRRQRQRQDSHARMTMVEAIRDAMDVIHGARRQRRRVRRGRRLFGGVFRCTQGLQRVRRQPCFDTPINELGIVGAAIGMAAFGLRPCVEIQFADYMYPAYDQIVSEAARLRYRSRAVHRPAGRPHADRRRHLRRPDPQQSPRRCSPTCAG